MRKHTKRKIYKLIDPITYGIQGAAYISESVLNKLRMMELASIDAFTKGQASREDWYNLTDMLNIAECMAKQGVGPEALDTIMKGQDELYRCAERFKIVGKYGLTGLGIQALRDCYEYHDLQRQSITRGEYERFIIKTRNKIISKSKDVKYVEPPKRQTA